MYIYIFLNNCYPAIQIIIRYVFTLNVLFFFQIWKLNENNFIRIETWFEPNFNSVQF